MEQENKNKSIPDNYYSGQEYVEDKNIVSVRFDIQLYSPAELLPFEFYYKKRRITGVQKGRYLNISFTEKLPRKLIDDIAWSRRNAQRYVYGYIFTPLNRVNQEMLRQRYALGHFLASTFSFFDIASITLTNIDETPTDEVIAIPWPPIFSAPPHSQFTKSTDASEPEVFVRDYIDAWNDFFRGDYDNCVRKLITSVENSFSFYRLNEKKKYPWWRFISQLRSRNPSFKKILLDLRKKSKFLGHEVVSENLLFLYQVRNKITHSSLRVHQENGWWLCGKGLETLQYLYQFLDGGGENSPGAYAFRTYGFANHLFHETRGSTVEEDEAHGKFMDSNPEDMEKFIIKNDQDMNEFKFNGLRISKEEQSKILNNKAR
jgi:hypothetical protein